MARTRTANISGELITNTLIVTSTGANVSNAVVKTGDTMTGELNVANNLVVTGNVGIGTSSTSNSFQINAVSPSIRLEETDSGGSKRLELSVANNGVVRISADQSSQEIAFSTVGTERIRIGSNGAVLVGTTSDPTGSTTQHFFSHSGNNATAFIVGDAVDNSSISGIYIRSLDPRLVRPTNIPISIADTSGNKHVVIDGTGRVGIGTTSPSVQLFVASAESGYTANLAESVTKSAALFKTHNSDSTVTSFGAISGGNGFIQRSNGVGTATYAICLNPFGGDIGIGTTAPDNRLDVWGSDGGNGSVRLVTKTSGTPSFQQIWRVSNTGSSVNDAIMQLLDNGTARISMAANAARGGDTYFNTGGNLLVGKTDTTLTTAGAVIQSSGRAMLTTSSSVEPLLCNRQDNDGLLVEFRQANAVEGSISVSGATVSYNAFAGSHWSQLQDGIKPDILRGTVMESINELCEWEGEDNERLPKCKISDTAGSKKVYGVFMAWDNDWTETNDMYVTAVGAFICRVNGSVTVQEGDLLESNGDGTARVQADDIIRSSTIGKVTSTVKTHEYDDGSYCVPTVLYCG